MSKVLFIDANRDGYSPNQCEKITVGELIGFLKDYPDEMPIYLRHDGGYTYGTITEDCLIESYVDEDDEDEDENDY